MGKLSIGRSNLRLDDRTLAHLEAVIVTKLRRRESFVFTWTTEPSLGSGRTAAWVHPAASIDFYFDSRPKALNPVWVELLMGSANQPGGLHLLPEPDES